MLAAKENCDLPVFVTMIFDEKGRLLTGADVKTAVAVLEGLGVDAIGFKLRTWPCRNAATCGRDQKMDFFAHHCGSQTQACRKV